LSTKEIAVISTTYNTAEQLERHLWSIANQDYPLAKFVCIVIDKHSTDNTSAVVEAALDLYPDLNLIYLKSNILDLGFSFAYEFHAEYVFLTCGTILWPSYAMSSHLSLHNSPAQKAWAITAAHHPDPNNEHKKLLDLSIDVMIGPRMYFVNLGEYAWQPAETLQTQLDALTLRYDCALGYAGDKPCMMNMNWISLQSCKMKHWLNLSQYPGTLEENIATYSAYRLTHPPHFTAITHPYTECYYQLHNDIVHIPNDKPNKLVFRRVNGE
jgi:hypothetical protein